MLVLPTIAVVAYRSWHAVSRYSARDDGYERLNDDNELGLRKAKADLRRDLWLGFLFVVASVCQGYVGVKLCVYDLEDVAQERRAAYVSVYSCLRLLDGVTLPTPSPRLTKTENTGLRRLRRPHDPTHKCGGLAPQQPRPVADPGAGGAATLAARARARTQPDDVELV